MRYSVGIDIGGTKIAGILINEKGKIIKKSYSLTEANKTKKKITENIAKTVDELRIKDIKGIGISASGIVDKDGKFIFNPNIKKLEGVNLKEILQRKFKCRVYRENDANCFALAEFMFGAGNGTKNMVGVIIGTGIGAGIIINKKLYSGSRGRAGEFGHSVINPNGHLCKCGLRGDFESFCSGPGIVKRYYMAGGKIKNAEPKKIFCSKEKIAKKVVKETCNYMGIGLSHIINGLDPDLIVLGGGISNIPFYEEINTEVKKYTNKALKKYVKVVKNKLGDSSGALGAAWLVFQNAT